MQWFPRRAPSCVVVGVDKALAMLQECTGYFDEEGRFVNTFDRMEVWAVHDGSEAAFEGDVMNVTPVMRVRGRYRDFAILETPTLGALTRGSRVATNVYEVLKAARGKQVLFFPARFDAHEVQAADGYAYQVAVQLFNQNFGKSLSAFVSTDAQGDWWGGRAAERWPTERSPASWATPRRRPWPSPPPARRHPAHRPRGLPERLRGDLAAGHPHDVPPSPRALEGGPGRGGGQVQALRRASRHLLQPARRLRPAARGQAARLRGQPAPRLPDARKPSTGSGRTGRSRARTGRSPSATAAT